MNEDAVIQDVLAGLLGPALIEGKDEIVDWITAKIQAGFPKLFDNIMKYATDQAFYEDKDYKPSDKVKDLARKYYGPLEEDSGISEQERDLREAMGKADEPIKHTKQDNDFGEEQAADLKNIFAGLREGPDNRF